MQPDYLIIGAGVIGCATALELARAGARVTVLERGAAGAESSWAGGGILSPLLPWDYLEPVTQLTRWGCELYPAWIAELQARTGIDPEYVVSGMLVLPPFDAEQAAIWCARHAMPLRQVNARSILPQLAPEGNALWLPDVAQVRNPRLLGALRRALELEGVTLIEHAEVTGLTLSGSRVAGLATSRGSYSAGSYVVTAGAWSSALLGDLALRCEVHPVRGQMLLFQVAPGSLPHIVLQNGIYLIPRRDGHILVGSTLEDAGFDKSTTADALETLRAAAIGILPQLGTHEVIRHWAGLRPGSTNNIPTIGRHPHVENLYVNSGHFRYGVTMAPGSARLLCNILFDRPQTVDVDPYRWRSAPGEE